MQAASWTTLTWAIGIRGTTFESPFLSYKFCLCALKGGLFYVGKEQADFLFRRGSVARLRFVAVRVVVGSESFLSGYSYDNYVLI
jgi:hypothetical protein